MSIIKNGQIWLNSHFKKYIKSAWNQFPNFNIEPKTCQKCLSYSTLVFDFFLQYLGFKRNKYKRNFQYVAMPMMTSQIL